jgi:thiol-disulfide isomerase/thioredoxin
MKNVLIVIVVVFALATGILAQRLTATPESATESTPQNTLPAFTLPDLSGQQRSISEWQGKILIINFWATWCPPCRKEIPEFIKLQQELGDRGLQFIGIAIEEKASVEKYASFVKINYPILIGEVTGIALSQKLGNTINALPFTIVVDRKGNIVHHQPGEFSRNQILKVVKPLLKKKKKEL